jgi:pimeloyl-ACP methyl ester carboxylesterase
MEQQTMNRSPDPSPAGQRRFRMDDGVELVADAWIAAGHDPNRRTAVLLHGGGQTRHAWKRTAAVLAAHGFDALAVDLRGHGESGWSPDGNYAIDRFAADVRALAASLPAPPILIGASLGGIASLIATGEGEGTGAAALVLVDITPRVDPEGVARIRGFMASHIDTGFATLEEAADAIAAYLPNRPRPRSLEGLRKNLRLGEDGRYRWHYDPAFVHRGAARHQIDSREERLSAAARRLRLPVLLVRGGSSELVPEAAAREFLAMVPGARFVDVQGAGHMVAGDVNDPFTGEVVAFLDRLPRPAPAGNEASAAAS